MIRVTKKDAIIHSTFFFRNFSEEYFERVKREVGNYLIVLEYMLKVFTQKYL